MKKARPGKWTISYLNHSDIEEYENEEEVLDSLSKIIMEDEADPKSIEVRNPQGKKMRVFLELKMEEENSE